MYELRQANGVYVQSGTVECVQSRRDGPFPSHMNTPSRLFLAAFDDHACSCFRRESAYSESETDPSDRMSGMCGERAISFPPLAESGNRQDIFLYIGL